MLDLPYSLTKNGSFTLNVESSIWCINEEWRQGFYGEETKGNKGKAYVFMALL